MTINAEQIFEKAHAISAHGLQILIATGPYHPTAASELDLAASDDWWLHRASRAIALAWEYQRMIFAAVVNT